MNRIIVLAACAALAAPAAALAAGQQQAPAATQAVSTDKPAQVKPRKERMVCKTQEEKGSRLGGKRICRTQAEWDDLAANQRQEIERRLSLGPARQ
jgi:Flp pilus assembly protein CpaB